MKKPCIFWNLQRLFEPRSGSVARALGVSSANWTQKDYDTKIENVAECLTRMTGGNQPALLAFAEVETLKIVQDIRARAGWSDMVSVDEAAPAPELEGHDVALLYNKTVFDSSPLEAESLTLNNNFYTRDLLHVRLQLHETLEEVEVIVAHWPSRLIREGNILRLAQSFYLKNLIMERLKYSKSELLKSDGSFAMPSPEELHKRWNTPCIILGDFNDEPYDESVRVGLGSCRDLRLVLSRAQLKGKCLEVPESYLTFKFMLYNPCWSLRFSNTQEIGGSYYHSPEWRTYDQVIVSHGLLIDGSPLRLVQDSVSIPRLPKFKIGSRKVNMTTKGGMPREFAAGKPEGVSDHFPIYFELEVNREDE